MVWLVFLVQVWIPIPDIDRVSVGILEGYVVGFFRTDDVAHFDAMLTETGGEISIGSSRETTRPICTEPFVPGLGYLADRDAAQ